MLVLWLLYGLIVINNKKLFEKLFDKQKKKKTFVQKA